jgi:membrane-bound inhibitor of C-type lysozyme
MRKFKFIFAFIVLAFFISSCDSNQLSLQKKVSLNFVDSNKDTIKVDIYVLSDDSLSFIKAWYQNQEYTLPQVVSADGARYSDGRDVTIWLVGDKLNFEQKAEKTKDIEFSLAK